MNAIVTYEEISNLIERKFKVCPTITVIDEKTVQVSYKPGLFMPVIGVKFRIENLHNDTVYLSYDCGKAASLVIAGIVAYFDKKIPNGIEVDAIAKRITIIPHNIDKLKQVLTYVSLKDVTFDYQSVNLTLSVERD